MVIFTLIIETFNFNLARVTFLKMRDVEKRKTFVFSIFTNTFFPLVEQGTPQSM